MLTVADADPVTMDGDPSPVKVSARGERCNGSPLPLVFNQPCMTQLSRNLPGLRCLPCDNRSLLDLTPSTHLDTASCSVSRPTQWMTPLVRSDRAPKLLMAMSQVLDADSHQSRGSRLLPTCLNSC